MPKCFVCQKTHGSDMTACPQDNRCDLFMPDKNNPNRKGWACRLAVQNKRCRTYCQFHDYIKDQEVKLRELKSKCRV